MLFDNEIYRGIADQPATLAEDPICGNPTLPTNAPATFRETASAPAVHQKKSRRRILKAIKLLASSVAAVSICVATGAVSLQAIIARHDWPWFGPIVSQFGFAFETQSKNGHAVQFSMGERSYRIATTRSDICMSWHNTFNISMDGSTGEANIALCSLTERWDMLLYISRTAYSHHYEGETYDSLIASTGEQFYLRAHLISDDKEADPAVLQRETRAALNTVLSSVSVTEATPYGWGKALICDTMYSEINEEWSGIATVSEAPWVIAISTAKSHSLDQQYLVAERFINDIHWKFYHVPHDGALWAIPQQETDVCLGANCDDLLNSFYTNGHGNPSPGGMARGGVEDEEFMGKDYWSDQQIQFMVTEMAWYLRYYHILN